MGIPIRKQSKLQPLCFSSDRRFGLELELLAFDGKNRPENGQKPAGIDYVGMVVNRNSEEGSEIRDWEHTSNNDIWVIKPDSSCGMEICTPIFKGWTGIRKCCEVVNALGSDSKIKVDNRCSVHLHVEVADLEAPQIASVINTWFKIEPIIMDAMPPTRKRNRYCQFMGMTSLMQHDAKMQAGDLLKRVGNVKYYSFNTNQMMKNGRKTIEFRTIEGDGCKDPFLVKNWIRFILHFVEFASKRTYLDHYNPDDPINSPFIWLDVEDTLKILGLNNNPYEYELSPGLKQMRNWFLARLVKYMSKDIERGPRHYAYQDLQKVLGRLREEGVNIDESYLSPSDMRDALFNEETKV